MVYESDFYTTRRPYTRPTVTSYSVTRREVPWHKVPTVPRPSQVPLCFTVFGTRSLPHKGVKLPGLGKGQTFHRNIPSIAHKRLVMITPSAHGVRVKQSMILGELDRINHKIRPTLAYQPTEDYLNSRSVVSFDDETRSIRAKTAEILRRIHTPVPRAQRPLPLPGDAYYSHSELPITDRISSDNYINRLLSSNKQVRDDIVTLSHYEEHTRPYSNLGRGHLACVSFAGGRPISKRRNLASTDDVIRDDIKVLSHYGRFRAAANGLSHVPEATTDYVPSTLPHRPPTKSSVTGSWKSNAPRNADKSTGERADHPAAKSAGDEFEAVLDKKKKRREAIEAAALREAEEEKRRKNESQRQDELAQQAARERQEEIERRAVEEEERKRQEQERAAQEAIERELEEQRAKEEAERLAQEEAERLAREEEERKEAEKKAKAEAKKKAKEEAERKAKEEAERKAKEEAERKAKEEEEQRAKEEAERKAKEEEERKAKEEAERLAKEEEERKAKEEAERLAKEEEERKAKEEADRLAKEEEERKVKEEEERKAQEEAERITQEEATTNEAAPQEAVEEAADAPIVDEAEPEPVVEEPQSPDAPVEAAETTVVEEVTSDTAEEE